MENNIRRVCSCPGCNADLKYKNEIKCKKCLDSGHNHFHQLPPMPKYG